MTFVTKLTLESGDRDTLDRVVEDIRDTVRRKGAELKGPHSEPPRENYVPLYKSLDGDESETFRSWHYTVYRRELEILGHDDLAREIMEWDYPDSISISADIERRRTVGAQ
ncbi:uS10/mL48 family ribosomal protein [Halospeciosus flavus]|uniref:Small ribosomal subunit protein uS10 n=1 Tax=Halospeciosus flavus TaxID=3032283 RepID=A0ABD5Z547_9EURY|nr:uS10/mL48 family ribosomal protein [Halospeciosus flavus]